MYVDNAIIYVHAKTKQQVAHKLTAALFNITDRHQIVSDLVRYRITVDPHLTFKKHVKRVFCKVKLNLMTLQIHS